MMYVKIRVTEPNKIPLAINARINFVLIEKSLICFILTFPFNSIRGNPRLQGKRHPILAIIKYIAEVFYLK